MRTERVFAVLFIVALAIKFSNIPGGSFLLTITLCTLSFLYAMFGFYFFSNKNLRDQNIGLSIIAGLLLCVAPLGILFRLSYWPGNTDVMRTGALSAALAMIGFLILRFTIALETLKEYYNKMIIRSATLWALCILFALMPMRTLLNIQYHNDPKMAELAYKAYSNPNDTEARQTLEEYRTSK